METPLLTARALCWTNCVVELVEVWFVFSSPHRPARSSESTPVQLESLVLWQDPGPASDMAGILQSSLCHGQGAAKEGADPTLEGLPGPNRSPLRHHLPTRRWASSFQSQWEELEQEAPLDQPPPQQKKW